MGLRDLLLVLHVLAAAAWFAAPLALVPMLRRTAPHGRAAFLEVARLSTRFGIIGAVGNVATIAFGVGLLFVRFGGFAGAPIRFHVGLGFVIIASVLGFVVQKPAGEALVRAAMAEDWTPERTDRQVRKLAGGVGAQHALWLAALVSMVWR